MSMIKRGHSDSSRPSVISSSKKCTKCGHCDRSSQVCPKCEGTMIDVVVESQDQGNCKDGICRL
jgi:ribosomal protein L32